MLALPEILTVDKLLPEIFHVLINETVSLTCNVTSSLVVVITWLYNGQEIDDNNIGNNTFQILVSYNEFMVAYNYTHSYIIITIKLCFQCFQHFIVSIGRMMNYCLTKRTTPEDVSNACGIPKENCYIQLVTIKLL